MFSPALGKVIICFQAFQPLYEQIQTDLEEDGVECILLRQGEISIDEITPDENNKKQILVLIDDAQEITANSSNIADIATRGRHRGISLFLIWSVDN